jgi:hypothetical protein
MTPMTCREAEPLLDLYAAGACDAEQATALSAHLADCAHCQAACDQARTMIELLDWNAREGAARQRLRGRIEAEARRQRRPRRGSVPLWVRQVGSLAALLLLTVGLAGWLQRGLVGPEIAVVPKETVLAMIAVAPDLLEAGPGRASNPLPEAMIAPAMVLRKADKVIHDSLEAVSTPHGVQGGAPKVPLALRVTNTADRGVLIRTDAPSTLLELELKGPGVQSRPVLDPAAPSPLSPRLLALKPGETRSIQVHRLESGRRGAWTAWSWTMPGDYTLAVRLRVEAIYPATAQQKERRGTLWLAAPAVRVRVSP